MLATYMEACDEEVREWNEREEQGHRLKRYRERMGEREMVNELSYKCAYEKKSR